jgi:hypothetical protein
MLKLALSLLLAAHAATPSLQEALKEYGVHVEGEFSVLKDQRLAGAVKKQHVIEAETAGRERFEIKVITPIDKAAARRLIDEELNGLRKLFAAADTPYMGDIAQAIGGCPAQYGPIDKKTDFLAGEADVMVGSASDKFAFGACSPEAAAYKGAFVAYYDEATKSVWSWRVFVPWTDKKSALKSDWLSPVLARFKK